MGRKNARARKRSQPTEPRPPSSYFYSFSFRGQEVRVYSITPARASKAYVCPYCQNVIEPGEAHVALVPSENVADRRHWHRACFERVKLRLAQEWGNYA